MRKFLLPGALAALAIPALAHGQVIAPVGATTMDSADSGDTAWLLAAATFGLALVVPGLALFYGGRARARGAAQAMLEVGAIAAVASLLWIVVGYTLAFGDVTSGWIGSGNAWMLLTLGNVRGDLGVPESAFALFQMAFAMLAPALVAGAWTERARFGWVIAFTALWSLIVYAPVAHWVWGGGWLATKLGTVDYAGGIVVQTTAGVSALVAAMLFGRRLDFSATDTSAPHRPQLALAGIGLMWAGWFGLAGGAAFSATDDAAAAILNLQVAACAAALTWMAIESFTSGKPSITGFATGALAGIAAASAAAGFIAPGGALLLGLGAGAISHGAVRVVKRRLHIDDAMDVFAINGIAGMIGAVALAMLRAPALGGVGYPEGSGLAGQMIGQIGGVAIVAIWSAFATTIAALMVSMVMPMRVTEDQERAGAATLH